MIDNEQFKSLLGISENYEMPDRLMNILKDKEERTRLFEALKKEEIDMSCDWFTELYQQEHGDRDLLKQDFTPKCLTKCLEKLVGTYGDRHADICAGTGGLTIAAWTEKPCRYYYCEEFSKRTIPVLLMNLAIRNMRGQVVHMDALTKEVFAVYDLIPGKRFSDIRRTEKTDEEQFDVVVMNPPYSMTWKEVDSYSDDERFKEYGIPPRKAADYAFVLHGFYKLKQDGKMWAIVPHGVLFRGGREQEIRKRLVDNGKIQTIIGLPGKMFLNTQIPVCLVEFGKNGCRDILVVDASSEYEAVGKRSLMLDQHIEHVVICHKNRRQEEHYASIATFSSVQENDYNLNIPRYVSTFVFEPIPNLTETLDEIIKIEQEIEDTEYGIYDTMQQLTGTTEESKRQLQQAKEKWKRLLITKYGTA